MFPWNAPGVVRPNPGADFPDAAACDLAGRGAVLRGRRVGAARAAVVALGRRIQAALVRRNRRLRLARAGSGRARGGHRVNPPNGLFIALALVPKR